MTRGQLLAAASALLYALQNLAMRVAAPEVDAFVVTLFAGLPTVATALAVTLSSPGRRASLASLWRDEPGGRRLLGGLAAAGVLMYVAGNPLFIWALALGGAVIASPSANTVVIWSALLAALLLRERLNRSAVAGILVFLGGVALLSWGQGGSVPAGPNWFWAVPLGALAGLCWSSGGIGTRVALARRMDPYAVLATYGVAGLGLILVIVLANGHLSGFLGTVAGGGFRTLTLMVLAGLFNLGGQITLTLALGSETVARAAVINASSVAVVAVLAWALLGETLNLVMLAGILAAFAGTALVQGQEAVQGSGTGDQ